MENVHPHERSVQAYSEMGSTSVSQQVVALYIVLMDGAIWFDGCTASFRLDFQLFSFFPVLYRSRHDRKQADVYMFLYKGFERRRAR